ncbi:hypothetical protein MTR_2g046850 [Medicago truncatula]|uniref:Uncharacterized protein n=1 Tax=Medicago truncatula TaxID=3880 RepID=A0A072V6R9_MEDTR|nr:hypothetical protein MTR_2g046850 [Medicago truncatula]
MTTIPHPHIFNNNIHTSSSLKTLTKSTNDDNNNSINDHNNNSLNDNNNYNNSLYNNDNNTINNNDDKFSINNNDNNTINDNDDKFSINNDDNNNIEGISPPRLNDKAFQGMSPQRFPNHEKTRLVYINIQLNYDNDNFFIFNDNDCA